MHGTTLVRLLVAGGLMAASTACGGGSSTQDESAAATRCEVTAAGRVDLGAPSFARPTEISNPRFPRGAEGQAVQLGTEAGDRLRFEITYLPDIKVIPWKGRDVETRVTHFVAYQNGRILETALDYYAQDDVGNVWYFGEDVSNYDEGVVVDHEGTWLAGRDGPPGMIMPATPRAGDAYRPENIPDLVLEHDTVRAVEQRVDGPRGPIDGAIAVRECLMDGSTEDKFFAPGYGEFSAEVRSAKEAYRVAVAVPADRATGPAPAALDRLSAAARSDDIVAIQAATDALPGDTTPPLLLEQLHRAVDARRLAGDADAARQATIDIRHAVLDLQLPYRPQADVDRDRLALWQDQLTLDQAVGDDGAVAGDRATIATIEGRIRP